MSHGQRRAAVDGAGQEIDLVHLEQLLGLLDRDGRVGLFVFVDEFQRTAGHTAGGIDLASRQVKPPLHLLANAGIGARQRRDDTDADGLVLGQGAAGKARQGKGDGGGAVDRFHVCLLLRVVLWWREGIRCR